MTRIHCHSLEETQNVAKDFAKNLLPGDVVAFFGEMGAGKTTFIKAIGKALGIPENHISSPTFQYLSIYKAPMPLFHFDLYRLKSVEDFLALGFEELFYKNGIACVEWSERILPILPERTIKVLLEHSGLEHSGLEHSGRETRIITIGKI